MAIQRLNLAPVGQCGQGKRRHHSEADAVRHADELRRSDRHNRPTAGPVVVYRCDLCDAWHVGHDV